MSLYGIIADLRRENPTPAATQTLDIVLVELGRTRDNLKDAVAATEAKAIPAGGKPILEELLARARKAGVDDMDFGPDPYGKPPTEALDPATAGIGILLAVTSLLGVALAIAALVSGLNAFLHFID